MTEEKPFSELEAIKDAPIAPAHGIAALALNMALKYHDIGTVQDGALYQQYKLEGKNLQPLHLNMVFETAILMEAHILAAPNRISQLIIDAVIEAEDDKPSEPVSG